MDSTGFIKLQRMPFKERLEYQYKLYQEEQERGYLMGRVANSAVGTYQRYQKLQGEGDKNNLNFGSNSYLGMGTNPYVLDKIQEAIQKFGVGTGGSPAFSGYSTHHQKLEKRLAALAGHDDAVLLPGGYMANLCWISGLTTRRDVLLYDKYSHASVINAIKMAGVNFFPFDPEDLTDFEELIDKVKGRLAPGAQLFSTVEGVRSIDGSVIELREWVDICRREEIVTILDDAHGVGTLGKNGKGTLEHLGMIGEVDYRMSTCSKGLGAQGAFVSGPAKGIFYLRTYSKPYVFTTALAHPLVAAISAGLDVLEKQPELVARLHANIEYMRNQVEDMGHRVKYSPAGIIPVFLPDGIAGNFNRALYERDLFAHVMEYPMVPPGLERLRLSCMAIHTREEMDKGLAIIEEVSKEFGVIH